MQFVDTHCHIQSAGNPVGDRSTGEIWAKDQWQEFYRNTKDSFEKIAENIFNEQPKENT